MSDEVKKTELDELRDELLSMMKTESESVTIGDKLIIVHELGAYDYAELWTDTKNEKVVGKHLVDGVEVDKTEVDMSRFTACLVAHSCKDINGNRIFSDEYIDAIKNSKKDIFMKLSSVARKLNLGDSTKNSEAITSESDSGESQSDLDLDTPIS